MLELSHSGVALGVTNALQFGPSLVLGLYGGVVADRSGRRRILIVTQSCLGLLALALGFLAGIGALRVWLIWFAALLLGLVKCFDLPALQSFVKDLVGLEDLANAIAWTNTISATGRMVGPVLGGPVLTMIGAAPGFLINAASFGFVVVMLITLHGEAMAPRTVAPHAPGQIRAGLVYVRNNPVLAAASVIMSVVFVAAFNFQVSLALIAADIMGGDSRANGSLMSALGLGAAMGSLILARHARTGLPAMLVWTGTLGVTQMALSGAHARLQLLTATFAYGVSAGLFSVTVISTLQERTADDMRGRVMALYSICFMGSSLMGGPGFGGLAQWIGVGGALRVTGSMCAIVALIGAVGCQAANRYERAE